MLRWLARYLPPHPPPMCTITSPHPYWIPKEQPFPQVGGDQARLGEVPPKPGPSGWILHPGREEGPPRPPREGRTDGGCCGCQGQPCQGLPPTGPVADGYSGQVLAQVACVKAEVRGRVVVPWPSWADFLKSICQESRGSGVLSLPPRSWAGSVTHPNPSCCGAVSPGEAGGTRLQPPSLGSPSLPSPEPKGGQPSQPCPQALPTRLQQQICLVMLRRMGREHPPSRSTRKQGPLASEMTWWAAEEEGLPWGGGRGGGFREPPSSPPPHGWGCLPSLPHF